MPQIDPDVGCVVPDPGQWPIDPQEDVPIQEDRLWIDGCFDFFHHGITTSIFFCPPSIIGSPEGRNSG